MPVAAVRSQWLGRPIGVVRNALKNPVDKEFTMDKVNFQDQVKMDMDAIHALLADSLSAHREEMEIGRSIHDLDKQRTDTTLRLLDHAGTTHSLAEQRTGMAKERTGLVREQTRLSTRSTELSNIRTELSHERTSLAGQRTDLAVLRTDFSRSRTNLADQRTQMARSRTDLSERRTHMAGARTVFSNMRTELARGRTHLALIRTGLAFLSLSIAFFRIFGLTWWSIFDGLLGLASLVMTVAGMTGYWRAMRLVQKLRRSGPAENGALV
jgi:uncharacterized membrane protein YidH (DUF202 family)